jgi:short-chain Z-isoprenyl diphosphate synthase
MRLKQVAKSVIYPLYERRIYRHLDFSQTPHHIGVILDGNRRWAKANPATAGDNSTAHGHKAGAGKIIDLLEWSEAAQVKVITLWLLSNQNLSRSAEELKPLLEIIGNTVANLANQGRWQIRPVGSLEILPMELKSILDNAAKSTKDIPGMVVNVAIGYGGRDEIVDAVKSLIIEGSKSGKSAEELAKSIDVEEISKHLYTAGLPDPDLVIRTSGEQRLGGFLLWQSAHSEFYFCEAYWPDFRKLDFLRALRAYSKRNRRFGI